MRQDVVHGFYGNKHASWKRVTPSFVKKLTLKCEKLMLQWLNEHTDLNLTSLADYRPGIIDNSNACNMAEEVQFNNVWEVMEPAEGSPTGLAIFDEDSSDEEEMEA